MLEHLEKQRNLKKITGGTSDENDGNKERENRQLPVGKKNIQAKINLKNSPKATDTVKQAENMASAYKEIDLSKDAPWLIVIAFSIIADLFTLIPIVGSIFALFFSVFFWFYYLINGHYKKRKAVKVMISGISSGLEILGVGLNMLPFFTTAAIINYWLVLGERKNKKTQE